MLAHSCGHSERESGVERFAARAVALSGLLRYTRNDGPMGYASAPVDGPMGYASAGQATKSADSPVDEMPVLLRMTPFSGWPLVLD
ncbi:MAG: hypothetical protein Q7S01_05060 [bacterium]|nr:hypothetical protein [bacterium]